jgi:hypothetical protein
LLTSFLYLLDTGARFSYVFFPTNEILPEVFSRNFKSDIKLKEEVFKDGEK